MITEDYVSFETAKLLKEKGYWNIATMLYKENGDIVNYNVPLNNKGFSSTLGVFYEAPTLQMAMKWLREKHKITIGILFKGDRIYYEIHKNNEFVFGVDTPEPYEKVCDEAINYCLKILI